MIDILTNQDRIDWSTNQIRRFDDLKKKIVWRIFHSFLNQKKMRHENSRHRELASSRFRVASRNDETFAKWWKDFEVMTAYFVINKQFHATHLKHFEPSAFWVLNIFSHLSFFFSFLFFSSSVCRLSIIRHLLDLFIELIVTHFFRFHLSFILFLRFIRLFCINTSRACVRIILQLSNLSNMYEDHIKNITLKNWWNERI